MKSKTTTSITATEFIMGGGEMGELTRQKDWSQTEVGSPENWPAGLKTIVNFLLNSKFPMFLWWGPGLTCFYNDAYRPSLGNDGKHPHILGMKAQEAWPEIWDIIKPLIDQVLATGEATWSENQLVPIYRNGGIEDVYWTYSYSPVNDDFNKPTGVFVTCVETTQQVETLKKIEVREEQLQFTIDAAKLGTWDLNPVTNKFSGNDRLKNWFALPLEEDIDLPLALSRIIEKDRQKVTEAIQSAMQYESGGNYDTEYTIHNPITNQEITVLAKGKALFDENQVAYRFSGTLQDITPQVNTVKKLRENEERLSIVIEASELGTWELNLLNNELHYGGRYLEIFGHQEDAPVSYQYLSQQIHPDDEIIRLNAFNRSLKTGTLHFRSRIIWDDQSIHWVEVKGTVSYDEAYTPVRVVGTIQDITEEQNYQQALRESEQKFRLLADSMPQFVWTSDPQGNLNYYNQSIFNYSGIPPEKVRMDKWLDLVHPDDREENLRRWMEAINTGQEYAFEHRFLNKDGNYYWHLSRAIPQKDAKGNIQMWVGTSADIHAQKANTSKLEKNVQEQIKELKRLNEALKKSEERYHQMVEEVQDYAIFSLNELGIVENWNKGAENIKGYTSQEIVGRNFSTFYPEQDRLGQLPEQLLELARLSGRASHEGWRVRKNGELFWANVVITAIHNDQNEVIGFSKVTHDLTDKKAAEDRIKANAQQLEDKNRELERMNTELQSFAYVSSHDLQEPLRKIKTFSGRLLDKEKENLSDSGKDILNRINNAVMRMQTLIEDILAYSRTNTGERIFAKVDIREIVNEIKEDIKEVIAEKNAMIELKSSCQTEVIPYQFKQLLMNLISNSLKFSKPEVKPHIQINCMARMGSSIDNLTVNPDKKYCQITIEDNGIGFEEEYNERIFEIFQRLHGKSEYTGTGIGLAIVKKIVENHNGFITASGVPNEGARFDVYLPCGLN
ncbi:PAS domain S-box protein [Emticicia sp. C21]|uniref:PAS domain S-box protein n=1 Tax=Emticicia sp. C21 TaxID=2302915 RepID=UPI000E3540CC|nr:PAS domain S-box protein [Emticicia sp. C21]RFS17019.1 PAS domain S-box protein [Emticicia sp. C21]